MTRDDITKMARDCGWAKVGREMEYPVLTARLERFAALVAAPLEEEIKRLRFCIPEGDAAAAMEYLAYCVEKAVAAEREACAKLCEEQMKSYMSKRYTTDPLGGFQERFAAERCAEAIRARGEQEQLR